MTVQDDQRERELCRLFNLDWDATHPRGGTDAHFVIEVDGARYRVETEVKSATSATVSTARDVGLDHIAKWRQKLWVVGFYRAAPRGPELVDTLCLTPGDMEPWIAEIEAKIRPDYEIARRASRLLTLDDLYAICGEKTAYGIEDAKRLHKSQWSAEQYKAAADMTVGRTKMISPDRMLEILKLRAQYIAERGATLNNPHITKKFLDTFATARLTANQAAAIREIAGRYIRATPGHPFPLVT